MHKQFAIPMALVVLLSCSSGPKPIRLGKDQCSFCKMTIMEGNFSAQSVTSKGKVFNYDDLRCQMNDIKRNASIQKQTVHYVANYLNGEEFLEHGQAFFVKAPDFNSPMAGNVAAFKTEDDANEMAEQKGGQSITLQDAFK